MSRYNYIEAVDLIEEAIDNLFDAHEAIDGHESQMADKIHDMFDALEDMKLDLLGKIIREALEEQDGRA